MGLDADYVARISPPGSITAFALLFAGPQATALGALLALRAELRESSLGRQDHAVAHARLGWWEEETERLIGARPVHPITRTLLASAGGARIDWTPLRGLILAARMELARVRFETEPELEGYLQQSGGSLHRVCAELALGQTSAAARFGTGLGRALRRCEILEELHRDVRHGFIALPLASLDRAGLPRTALQQPDVCTELHSVFDRFAAQVRAELAEALAAIDRPARRQLTGQLALAAGYTRRLAAHRRRGWRLLEPPPPQRPSSTLWTIWRTVRRLEFDEE